MVFQSQQETLDRVNRLNQQIAQQGGSIFGSAAAAPSPQWSDDRLAGFHQKLLTYENERAGIEADENLSEVGKAARLQKLTEDITRESFGFRAGYIADLRADEQATLAQLDQARKAARDTDAIDQTALSNQLMAIPDRLAMLADGKALIEAYQNAGTIERRAWQMKAASVRQWLDALPIERRMGAGGILQRMRADYEANFETPEVVAAGEALASVNRRKRQANTLAIHAADVVKGLTNYSEFSRGMFTTEDSVFNYLTPPQTLVGSGDNFPDTGHNSPFGE